MHGIDTVMAYQLFDMHKKTPVQKVINAESASCSAAQWLHLWP